MRAIALTRRGSALTLFASAVDGHHGAPARPPAHVRCVCVVLPRVLLSVLGVRAWVPGGGGVGGTRDGVGACGGQGT